MRLLEFTKAKTLITVLLSPDSLSCTIITANKNNFIVHAHKQYVLSSTESLFFFNLREITYALSDFIQMFKIRNGHLAIALNYAEPVLYQTITQGNYSDKTTITCQKSYLIVKQEKLLRTADIPLFYTAHIFQPTLLYCLLAAQQLSLKIDLITTKFLSYCALYNYLGIIQTKDIYQKLVPGQISQVIADMITVQAKQLANCDKYILSDENLLVALGLYIAGDTNSETC